MTNHPTLKERIAPYLEEILETKRKFKQDNAKMDPQPRWDLLAFFNNLRMYVDSAFRKDMSPYNHESGKSYQELFADIDEATRKCNMEPKDLAGLARDAQASAYPEAQRDLGKALVGVYSNLRESGYSKKDITGHR